MRNHLRPLCALVCLLATEPFAWANPPGGGTGTGPNVTLVDNGDGTVTMANGIVSIVITKADATVHQINYTYNNGSGPQTLNVLSGGTDGGEFYWEFGGFGAGAPAYSVVANTPDYAEVDLLTTSASSGSVDIHFSLPRGASGFYVTPIWIHSSADSALSMGECRDNIYSGSMFNWMSVDATRNRLMEVSGGSAIVVQGAPVECSLWTNGIYAGQYEDKYKYSADFGVQRVWGWSSVGNGGRNIGLWDVAGSVEYYPGGPMKRELMSHIGTTILNTPHGSHYGGGTDSSWAAGEIWAKVCGPHFIYCNAITNTITATNAAAQALYGDALAQSAAEATAWPYAWFTNQYYTPAAGRGTVTGQIVIQDAFNPNASASNLWVGVEVQPNPASTVTYDFQEWYKPYQFWTKTDVNGNFTISNVIAGANYTLYAFGPGAAGMFQSQAQTGGAAPNELDLPTPQFSVNVTAGATNNLGVVTWTPLRTGPTVFEIGYPDHTAAKFRHGEDWWVGDIGPGPTNPLPVWTKYLEYPFDFPTGPNYTVGQSRWSTDWNFIQPVVVDASGNYNPSTSTINFNLAAAPATGATAALYLALASDYQGALIVQVNGNNLAGSSGYFPAYSSSGNESDASIREGIHGIFSDNRMTFAGNLLQAGANSITITMRKGGYFANHAMYDYVRLELTGYVPPPPASVTAYPGNGSNLICWPVPPGATSYNILRSTTPGGAYLSLTNGVTGPVCGSGYNNATYLDASVVNGSNYYYVVQSVNPAGSSTNSPPSSVATPSAALAATAPAAPAGVTIGGVAHQSVTVNWSASAGANFYTVCRSTLFNNGGGASNVLRTIVLNNTNTTTSFTDTAVTDGSIYSYFVTATSAAGISPNSVSAVAVPLPAPPATAPGALTGLFNGTGIVLHWSAVPGAAGYLIRHATSASGPYAFMQSVTETTYTDAGLNPAATYYYQVTAVNAAGVSSASAATVVPPPTAPISLSAFPGNALVTLSWTSVPGVTGYYLFSGTSSGNETNLVAGIFSGTSCVDTGVVNGVTYYYVVASTNSTGLSPNSPEASATPNTNLVFTPRSLTWVGDGIVNVWDASGAANWQTNSVSTIFNNGDTVTFDNSGSYAVPVYVAGTPAPAVATFNSSRNYTLGGVGSLSGTGKLIKTGTGTLTINNTNLHSGGTIISNSTVLPGNIAANGTAWGTGPITLAGGTIQFNGYGGSTGTGWGGCGNPIIVPAGQLGALLLPPRWGYSAPFTSALSGGGTLYVVVDYVRDIFSGDWSAFTGQINVLPRSTSGDFRINNPNGYANAAIYLNNGVNFYDTYANGQTVDIGELGGSATAFMGAGGTINPTWRIGAKNTTNTYAGTLADAGVTTLIKTGAGMLVLSGANTFSGGTTVNSGVLLASNVTGSATGTGGVVVNSGGTLAGTGAIAGAVTVNSGGALAPGNLPNLLPLLTLSNNLTLAAGSTTFAQVEHSPLTNTFVKISGTLTAGGTLNVTNISPTALANGDRFQLFNAGSYAGSFTACVLPPLAPGLAWNTSALGTGVISVTTLASPVLGGATLDGHGNVALTASGVPANWFYRVLTATNESLPVSQWTPVATNQTDAAGNLNWTNPGGTPYPMQFFRLQLP